MFGDFTVTEGGPPTAIATAATVPPPRRHHRRRRLRHRHRQPGCTVEGFDDITNLPGWFMQNNSHPLGTNDWFQGNPAAFVAHSGATNSYIGANFNNTGGAGTISNWLLTPVVTMENGTKMTFWTRTCDRVDLARPAPGTREHGGCEHERGLNGRERR